MNASHKSDAKNRLSDLLSKGLAIDIFLAEQALAIEEVIGKNAEAINKANFGRVFGPIQTVLVRDAILATCRLFEPEKQFPLRSIPAAIKLLDAQIANLQIEQRHYVVDWLVKQGYEQFKLAQLGDRAMTQLLLQTFSERLPQGESSDLTKAWKALKTRRDKVLAHHEVVEASALPQATYADLDKLLDYAKDFVSVIGMGYLSTAFSVMYKKERLSSDAGVVGRGLRRLLRKTGILSDR